MRPESQAVLVRCTALLLLPTTLPAADQPAMSEAPLEEIVVTAQKREERAQDVPISIAALQGDEFEKSGARGIADTLNQVGGVNLVELAPGRSTISIRGASAGAVTLTGSAPVGYYLDEIPFSFVTNAILPDVNAFDLERVEVLRGPQGTLYGASSLNGVVRVLTHDANLDAFEIKGRTRLAATRDSEDSYNGDLMINVPAIPGKLGLRAVASYADLGGFISTANTADFNDSEIQSYRLKLNAAPSPALAIELSAWASRIETLGPASGAVAGSADSYVTPFSDDQRYKRDYEAYNIVVSYDLPLISVQSSTGYLDLRGEGAHDFLIAGVLAVNLLDELNAEVLTEEVRFVSNFDGPWKLAGGVFYRDVEQLLSQSVLVLSPFALQFTDESEAFAVFGEVTRSFADGKLELTGGLRYFEDTVTTTEQSSLFTGTTAALLPPVESEFDAVTWRAVAAYHPSRDLTLYGSVATGFRSGFNQAPLSLSVEPDLPPVEADELLTYEFGAKGSALQGRLLFDTAVYYTTWDGTQQATITALGSASVINVDVEGAGVDASVIAQLTERFALNAAVGWNSLEFDETVDQIVNQQAAPLFPKGDRINLSPELTASLGAEYRVPMGRFTGLIGADARYHSELIAHDVAANPITGIPESHTTRSDTITVVGVRAGIEADHWTITLFGENVTDEDGAVDPGTLSDPGRTRLRPRTIALQGTFSF